MAFNFSQVGIPRFEDNIHLYISLKIQVI